MSYRKHVALTLGQHWATAVCLWCGGLFIQLGHITYIITFYLLVCRSIRVFFVSLFYFHCALPFPSLPLPSPPHSLCVLFSSVIIVCLSLFLLLFVSVLWHLFILYIDVSEHCTVEASSVMLGAEVIPKVSHLSLLLFFVSYLMFHSFGNPFLLNLW